MHGCSGSRATCSSARPGTALSPTTHASVWAWRASRSLTRTSTRSTVTWPCRSTPPPWLPSRCSARSRAAPGPARRGLRRHRAADRLQRGTDGRRDMAQITKNVAIAILPGQGPTRPGRTTTDQQHSADDPSPIRGSAARAVRPIEASGAQVRRVVRPSPGVDGSFDPPGSTRGGRPTRGTPACVPSGRALA